MVERFVGITCLAWVELCELGALFVPILKMWKLRSRERKCEEPEVTQLGEERPESRLQEPEEAAGAGIIRPILQRLKPEAR